MNRKSRALPGFFYLYWFAFLSVRAVTLSAVEVAVENNSKW